MEVPLWRPFKASLQAFQSSFKGLLRICNGPVKVSFKELFNGPVKVSFKDLQPPSYPLLPWLFPWSSPSFPVTSSSYGFSYGVAPAFQLPAIPMAIPCYSYGVAPLAPLGCPWASTLGSPGSPWVPLLTGQQPMRKWWPL